MLQVTASVPSFCSGFATQCVSALQLDKYTPERVHLLDSFASQRDTVVDIACKARASGCYTGDDKSRQTVALKFGDFVDHYQTAFVKSPTPHWLQAVDDLEFYLCQCPVAVFEPDATCSKASLPRIMDDLCIPKCLETQRMRQVNLWMTVQSCRTSLHYDAYQNILVVLHGCKTVTLYAPSETAKLYPHPVFTTSANHSQVDISSPDLAAHPEFVKATSQRLTVSAGDALFIPEGWWHQVDSDEFTIAVNYWWDGLRPQLVADQRMTPYYSRVLLEELVKQESDARLRALRLRSSSPRSASLHEASDPTSAFLAATSQQDREEVLLSLEDGALVQVQRELAQHHAAEWLDVLSKASVDLVAVLAACWESPELDADFLAAIFAALGDQEEPIKLQLVAKQEQFRQHVAARMFKTAFGFN